LVGNFEKAPSGRNSAGEAPFTCRPLAFSRRSRTGEIPYLTGHKSLSSRVIGVNRLGRVPFPVPAFVLR